MSGLIERLADAIEEERDLHGTRGETPFKLAALGARVALQIARDAIQADPIANGTRHIDALLSDIGPGMPTATADRSHPDRCPRCKQPPEGGWFYTQDEEGNITGEDHCDRAFHDKARDPWAHY